MRPRGVLVVMAVTYATLVIAAGAHIALGNLSHLHRAFENEADAGARVLEERMERVFDATDHVIDRVVERLSANKGSLDVHQVADLLQSAPFIANILVLDPAGLVVLQARGDAEAGDNWSGRPWVQALREDKDNLQVGASGADDGSRALAIPISRRVTDRQGQVTAVVAVLVDVGSFRSFLQSIDGGRAAVLGVQRSDGTPLLRLPWRNDDLATMTGEHLPQGEALQNGVSILHQTSTYDGISRVIAMRPIPNRELTVWVGLSEASALALWRGQTVLVAVACAVCLIFLLGLSLLLMRQLIRESQVSADLVSLNRDLERSNADLEQFAYIASHDLKEPLRNIASYVQLLQRRYHGQLDPDADAFIGYTVEGVRRLQAIINELLAYSRIGTGQLDLLPVQSGALVSTALAHLKGMISEAQAVVEVKGPLPVVQADSTQLASLFQNLIGNALKYRREDVRPEVIIGADDRGGDWAFYVRDNGIGIDTQYHRQIFELFKRLHPRDRYTGTGIGLAVCQRVVERHGGRIWVESVAGKGSTFWFTLPKRLV